MPTRARAVVEHWPAGLWCWVLCLPAIAFPGAVLFWAPAGSVCGWDGCPRPFPLEQALWAAGCVLAILGAVGVWRRWLLTAGTFCLLVPFAHAAFVVVDSEVSQLAAAVLAAR